VALYPYSLSPCYEIFIELVWIVCGLNEFGIAFIGLKGKANISILYENDDEKVSQSMILFFYFSTRG